MRRKRGILETKSKCDLSHARIYGGAANDAKRGGGEVGVGIRELRMVQGVVKLRTKLDGASLTGPVQGDCFGHREIEVCLSRTVDDTRRAVAECRSDAIRTNDGRSGKTGDIKIAAQPGFDWTSRQELAQRTRATQLGAVFSDSENVFRVGIGDGQSTARLKGCDGRQRPVAEDGSRYTMRRAWKSPGGAEHEPVGAIKTCSSPALARRILISQGQ